VGASPPEVSAEHWTPADLVGLADEIGVALTLEQAERLARYTQLLLRWNRVHNLTAIAQTKQALSHHLLDSLAILPSLRQLVKDRSSRVLDVGSGGGLPGIPIAIAAPDFGVTLIDRVQKKVAFLQQAKAELHITNLQPVHGRVEDYNDAQFDLIVARAFSSLGQLVRSSRHLIAANGHWCAMKGAVPAAELAELALPEIGARLTATIKLRVPRLNAERHLMVLEPY
jgi:16S rRNA (guanine527-N7)-methyltransferase